MDTVLSETTGGMGGGALSEELQMLRDSISVK